MFERLTSSLILDEIVQEGTDVMYECIYVHLKINGKIYNVVSNNN